MSAITKIPMTVHGADQLRNELFVLKSEKRPKIIEAISTAREHGDLKENAEYHAAREQQSFVEGRISEIEEKLSSAQIVDISEMQNDGKVIFASTVTIVNVDTDVAYTYQIVGDDEADIKNNKISFSSPISKSLIGKYQGDEVEVITPNGKVLYEIEAVTY